MSFWGELRRRNVFKVGAAYALVAWIIAQVISVVNEPLGLPGWFDTTVLVFLVIGFPVALLFAWAYELTPAGLKRAGDVLKEDRVLQQTGQKLNYVVVALFVGAMLGSGSVWLLSRDVDLGWAREEAIPQIERLISAGDWEGAFALAKQVQERILDEPLLEDLWPRFSWLTTIPSEPPGASVYRRAYSATDDDWEELGVTPLKNIRIPFGLSRIRIELEGYERLERMLGGGVLVTTELPVVEPSELALGFFIAPERFRLDTEETLPPRKVRVPGWSEVIDGEAVSFRDFLLDRFEVTNGQYLGFVEAGGYEREEFWQHPFVLDGRRLTWQEAMAFFTDRTGRPGPSTWVGGTYPDGQEDYPVGGVSWYEAMAYARFVGQSLPTYHHWRRAYATGSLTWLLPASNLAGSGPAEVGQFDGMGWTGTYDMAGNVREWTFNAIGDGRSMLGGAWNNDFFHAQGLAVPFAPFARDPTNGFRLAIIEDEPQVAAQARRPLAEATPRDFLAEQSVSDEVFEAFRSQYIYDPTPLNAEIEAVEETTYWTRERITFDAAYGGERMALYLYLPKTGAAPLQTVIYGPGGTARFLNSVDDYPVHLDFVLRSGRAVAFPVFKGTFERRGTGPPAALGTAARRDELIQRIKDLSRSIDYLETRSEIDSRALSFYGHSFGGQIAAQVLAIEPRIAASVLYVVGMPSARSAFEEIEPMNFLPRVDVPVLMLNGQYDAIPPASAIAYYELLGTPAADKKHVLAPGDHFVPRDLLVRETLDWLDQYFGYPSS